MIKCALQTNKIQIKHNKLRIPTGGRLTSWLFTRHVVELWPPKTNPSSGREEDLNPEPMYYKSSALPLGHARLPCDRDRVSGSLALLPYFVSLCEVPGTTFLLLLNSFQTVHALLLHQELPFETCTRLHSSDFILALLIVLLNCPFLTGTSY